MESVDETNPRQYTWSEALSEPYYRIHMMIGEVIRKFHKRFWPERYVSRRLFEETTARYEAIKELAHFLEMERDLLRVEYDASQADLQKIKRAFEVYGTQSLKHIQSLEENGAKLAKLCIEDHLTGLNNRRGLEEKFTVEVGMLLRSMRYADEHRKPPPIIAMAIDLDHFKKVNDIYGHAAGDQVLLVIAELVKRHCGHRPEDIIARIGGDEFVAILPRATWESAYQQATLFTIAVREDPRLQFPEHGIAVTASVGIARMTLEAGTSIEKVLSVLQNRADQALYVAKESRNMVIRHDHMSPSTTVLAALTTTPAPFK